MKDWQKGLLLVILVNTIFVLGVIYCLKHGPSLEEVDFVPSKPPPQYIPQSIKSTLE